MSWTTRSYTPLNSCLRLHEEQRDHRVTPDTGAGLAVRRLEVWTGLLTRQSGVGGKFFFCEGY